jgi:signal transduction histidine kinase
LAFLLVCVLTAFGLTVYERQRVNRFRRIDAELELRVAALSRLVREVYRDVPPGAPPVRARYTRLALLEGKPNELPLSSQAAALFGDASGAYYFTIWYRDGSVLKRSANAPTDVTLPERFERDTLPHFRTRQTFREALHCSGLGECALAGYFVQADIDAVRNFRWTLLAAGGAVLAFGLGAGWWFTTRAIRPIEQISAAASRISQGNLSERVLVDDRGDELGQLASVLNGTFAKLESAFAQQQRFTADAAHQLRTPLAVIISETQTTLARDRTAAEYRETVQADLDTAQQMRRLTESLLELARLDSGNESHPRANVDLAEAARLCVDRTRPLAAQHSIRLHGDFASAQALCVPDRLDQLIGNLLTNAIYYNKAGGEVHIATFTEADAAVLTIADTGFGIAPADLPHIFNRFYRGFQHADEGHSRAVSHAGLGLAICKAIVDAEGGTIEAASTLHTGTTFTVRLPQGAKTSLTA